MRAIPFPFETLNQTVKIYINNRLLHKLNLLKGWNEYSIFAPESFWKSGENIIRFHYTAAHIPKVVFQDSEDTRHIAMGLDYIKIEEVN